VQREGNGERSANTLVRLADPVEALLPVLSHRLRQVAVVRGDLARKDGLAHGR
jgi:ribosomal protein L19